ncbi:MAG: hypothetical protein L3K09_08245, partial [Thermoplasmata archaeon]|nr:hypothetical protein [Thermoplasmata archaeon]
SVPGDQVGADALKIYLLGTPYHARLDWSDDALTTVALRWGEMTRLWRTSVSTGARGGLKLRELLGVEREFVRALADGLGADRALGVLSRWAEVVASSPAPLFQGLDRRAATAVYRRVGALLGVDLFGVRARAVRRSH